jgi:hypothetical protein
MPITRGQSSRDVNLTSGEHGAHVQNNLGLFPYDLYTPSRHYV